MQPLHYTVTQWRGFWSPEILQARYITDEAQYICVFQVLQGSPFLLLYLESYMSECWRQALVENQRTFDSSLFRECVSCASMHNPRCTVQALSDVILQFYIRHDSFLSGGRN